MGSRRRRRGQWRGAASSGRRARRAAPPRGSRCAATEPSVLQHPPALCGPGNACRPPRCLKHSGMGGPRTAGRGSSTCLLAFCVFAAGLWIATSHTSKNFNPCHAQMVPKPLVCPLTTIGHPGRIATWLLHAPCSTELCLRGSYMHYAVRTPAHATLLLFDVSSYCLPSLVSPVASASLSRRYFSRRILEPLSLSNISPVPANIFCVETTRYT